MTDLPISSLISENRELKQQLLEQQIQFQEFQKNLQKVSQDWNRLFQYQQKQIELLIKATTSNDTNVWLNKTLIMLRDYKTLLTKYKKMEEILLFLRSKFE